MLLSGSPFVFVIDLAALASRREYLKLDKWLKDKLKEHQVTSFLVNTTCCWTLRNLSSTINKYNYFHFQEEFAQACVSFLRRRCPHLLGVPLDKELPKSVQLPQETIVTVLSCLQSFMG